MTCVSLIFSSWIFKNADVNSMPNRKVTMMGTKQTFSSTSASSLLAVDISGISTASPTWKSRRNARAGSIVLESQFISQHFLMEIELKERNRAPI